MGHVGIGTHLVPRAVRERLPWRWLALGCLLPDVIDKPVWLVAQWLGAESQVWDTARMFGHTAFLLAALWIWARLRRTPALTALGYGMVTHIVLDIITDKGMGGGWGVWKSWLFWPFEIPRLRILMVASPLQELASELQSRVYMLGEIVGAALLIWDFALNRSKRS